MPSVITISGAVAGHGGDACKWAKRNKRTGCQAKVCHTGLGKSGWQIVENVCERKERQSRKPRRKRGRRKAH